MQDLLGAECDLAEILCVYSLHKNLSGLSEGIYRIGLICGGGGCERACKCAARRAGAASVEFDRNLCGSIFYAIFNHIYAILARLERKRCGFNRSQLPTIVSNSDELLMIVLNLQLCAIMYTSQSLTIANYCQQ